MIFWGMITSIFWALVVAVILWILCAFSGRLVNSAFRMSVLQHLLCFAVAAPTVVLLVIVFTCNKLNRLATKADDTIVAVMMADGRFVEQLTRQIETKPNEELVTDLLAGEFAENISSEYPLLGKYIDVDNLANHLDIGKHLQNFPKGVDAGNAALQIVQSATGKFTEDVRKKIKSTRRKALITVVLLQAVCFGVVVYMTGTYRSVSHSAHYNRKRNIKKKYNR